MEKKMKTNVRYFVPVLLKRQKQPFADVFNMMFLKILQCSQENTCVGVSS